MTSGAKSFLCPFLAAVVLEWQPAGLAATAEATGRVSPEASACAVGAVIVPAEPTYYPGVPFRLELRPKAADWPTTPAAFGWQVGSGDQFLGSQIQEFVINGEAPTVKVIGVAEGPGIPGSCQTWYTDAVAVVVRRFDYIPTPTPSPSPTPSPCTPVGLPCDDPAMRSTLLPPHGSIDNPTSLVLHVPGLFLGMDTNVPGNIGIEPLGNGDYAASGLLPGKAYIVYFSTGSCWPGSTGANLCLNLFSTANATPTPTSSPTPPPPSAVPSPTAAGIVDRWLIGGAD